MGKKYNGAVRRHIQFNADDTLRLCKNVLDSLIPNEFSETFNSCYGKGDFTELVGREFRHSLYSGLDPGDFHDIWTSFNLVRKFPNLPGVKVDKAKVAINKMLQCEAHCKTINNRLLQSKNAPGYCSDYGQVLYLARRKIASWLGEFSWDHVVERFDFGPGASTRLPRSRSDLFFKMQGCLHLTENLLPVFNALSAFKPGLFPGFTLVPGNKIVTVPKDSKTDRPIAIEPDFNIFVQKGLGEVLRELLKKRTKERVDLHDQTLNQRLARLASLGFGLSTIDLSSASDTVSYELVCELLPSDWRDALLLARSPCGALPDGTLIRYHKWSSMGNGYTFELESLIFHALAQATIEHYGDGSEYATVYGDDIVISSSLYSPFTKVLEWFGFIPNHTKSFHEGPFYESCGKHYFKGRDVTPVYIDDIPRRTIERIALVNELILLSSRMGSEIYRDIRLKPSIQSILTTLPDWLQRPRAPVSCKGNAVIGDFDECTPERSLHYQRGFKFRGLIETSVNEIRSCEGVLRKSLYQLMRRRPQDRRVKISSFLGFPVFTTVMYSGDRALMSECLTIRRKSRSKDIWTPEWSYLGPWF